MWFAFMLPILPPSPVKYWGCKKIDKEQNFQGMGQLDQSQILIENRYFDEMSSKLNKIFF